MQSKANALSILLSTGTWMSSGFFPKIKLPSTVSKSPHVNRKRRKLALFVLISVAALPVCASSFDEKPMDQQTIDDLKAKVLQAQPRDQYFLYAQIVHQMTELSLRQYAAGDGDKASALLKNIQEFTHKIRLADDNKRLKEAEMLLRHTAFRLNEMLHTSSFEDRPLVAETLSQVNQAQNAAMMEVFRK